MWRNRGDGVTDIVVDMKKLVDNWPAQLKAVQNFGQPIPGGLQRFASRPTVRKKSWVPDWLWKLVAEEG